MNSYRVSALATALIAAMPAARAAAGAAPQAVASIEAAAREAALAVTAPATHRSPPQPQVDPRLQLAACEAPLRATVGAYRLGATRLTVRVECPGQIRWSVWVPVLMQLRLPVVVANRSIARDTLLEAGDLKLVERDADGSVPAATEIAAMVGRRTRSDVTAGELLSAANTTSDQLVRRGQQVTLVLAGAAIQVSAKGVAQSDGGLGARIRVRSVSSDRIVEGVVRSSETVEVLFPGTGSG
ncbi:MAG TPA: flagellar basal body P-ring formation chaperone FlgA [Steroidobacteraceae bacterium]|nr:flagellar basal body P-ring formation chaperone FlgA [Steroidobacteraceae bacterium]